MQTTLPASEALQVLHERRSALERAVRIAASIERLQHGLQAAMLMGKSAASIPQKMIDSLDRLDDAVKVMPSPKLKAILARLEQEVQKRFTLIMQLAQRDEAELIDVGLEPGEDVEALLRGYRKKAQTAVALKVLLHARGEITKPIPLPVPVEDIRRRLGELNEREQKCRKQVRTEIVVLVEETDQILARTDLPEGMREPIAAMRQELALNLAHLDAGGAVISLPVGIEVVTMGEAGAEVPVVESQAPLPQEMGAEAPLEATPETAVKPQKMAGRRPGLFYKIRRWVTTPFNVTWQDIERELDEKYGKKK